MEAETRKKIFGQWGVRKENDLERTFREKLEEGLEDSPLLGKPLQQRKRNFRPSVYGQLLSLGGPLPYMVRLREIEEQTEWHKRQLAREWRAFAEAANGNAGSFERRWRQRVSRWNFDEVNELIERHNRFYPTEARLPMDVRRRDFALVNGRPYWRRRLDAVWVLERFPANLSVATARLDGVAQVLLIP